VLAGMETSASYVGRYGTYRTLRHTGLAPRPRQILAKGAMGNVRRIPSAVKGRRAHPHMVEKKIVEKINRKEYAKALESAVAATANTSLVAQSHAQPKESLPIVVSSDIEKVAKTRELVRVLDSLGLAKEIEMSHKPRLKTGNARRSRKRYFRNSVVIVAKEPKSLNMAGSNIPGVDVLGVDHMRIEVLAPGAKPRLTIWTEAAVSALTEGISKSSVNYKQ
jgi:large subunit ribosomal protein L4e